jgi:hypothetical protein
VLCAVSAATFVVMPYMSFEDVMRGLQPSKDFSSIKLFAFLVAGVSSWAFIAALWHFALIFPRPRPIVARRPGIVAWIYGGPMAALVGASALACAIVLARLRRDLVPGLVPLGLIPAALALWMPFRARLGAMAPPVRAMLGLAAVVWILAMGTAALRGVLPGPLRAGVMFTLVGVHSLAYMGFFLIVPLAVMVALLRSYRESPFTERQQLRWPLWALGINTVGGVTIGLGSLALSMMLPPSAAIDVEWVASLLSIPLYLCLPIGFAIGIVRYRLMDLDFVLRKTWIYFGVTALMVVAYVAVVGGLGGWIVQSLGVTSTWVTVFGTLAVATLFVPARNRVQGLIDRRFYRSRYEVGESLRRLGEAYASAGDARDLARATVEELHRALRVRGAQVLVPDGSGRGLVPCVDAGGATDPAPVGLRAVTAALADRGARPGIPEPLAVVARRTGAVAVAPIRRRGELLGVLLVGPKLSDEGFEAADLDYLDAVAGQLGAALSSLESPVQDRELREAREIQAALLPKTLPALPGIAMAARWLPARRVAGDYYDVFTLDDGRAAFCIADVSGKGMPAALLMSNLQATVKTFAAGTATAAELCARVNRVMASHLAPGRFITMFFGLLGRDRDLHYTNAGHNPPILLRADGTALSLDRGGPLLGAFPEARYEQAVITLEPGDRLALFTDGVVEAMNDAGELYGDERMVEALRRHAVADAETLERHLLEDVTAFCAGEFQDDATVLVVTIG